MATTEEYGNTEFVVNSYDNQFYTLDDTVDLSALTTVDALLTALETKGKGLGTVNPGSVVQSLTKSVNPIKSDNKNKTVKVLPGTDNSATIAADFQESENPEVRRLFYGVAEDENGNQVMNTSKLVSTKLAYISWDIDNDAPVAYVGEVTASPNGDITRQGSDVVILSILFTYKGDPQIIRAREVTP